MPKVELNERQKELFIKIIKENDLNIKSLIEEGASSSTVYNDIKLLRNISIDQQTGRIFLATKHKFIKTHFDSKLWVNREAKQRIASFICKEVIEIGDCIFLDCGSSAAILSEEIIENNISGLTVYTTNPTVLKRLFYYQGINNFFVIGGEFFPNESAFYGEYTAQFIKELLDIEYRKLFFGVDNISIKGQLHINNIYEVEQKKAMIEKAKEVYVICDESKIENIKGRQVGNLLSLIENKGKNNVKILVGRTSAEDKNFNLKKLKDSFKSNVIIL